MGFGVVAEGVENKAILDQLVHLDCDTAQGFYFSRPLPVDEFMNWLKDTSLPALPPAADSANSHT
jgi:EAL domain-containing protein (putative c-di-GMP-specific phosphodiesterase class I)